MRSYLRFTAAGTLCLAMSTGALAAGELFTSADAKSAAGDPTLKALTEGRSPLDVRIVDAHPELLATALDSLRVPLANGVSVAAYRLDSYVNESGHTVWSGLIEDTSQKLTLTTPSWFGEREVADDPLSSAIFVRNGDKITGNVHIGNTLVKVRPLASGKHAIVTVDASDLPPDHPPEFEKAAVVPMKHTADNAKAVSTIRVMVNYTSGAASQSGDINGLISLAMAEANQGYVNSGVEISLVLANKSQVSYTETGNFTTDLNRYRGTSDGYMDSIHTTRNTYAADVAVLIVKNTAYCGLASGIGSTASTAFAEVYWDCATGYYSFAHEIGHLQSARHDPTNDPTNTPYAYGHGYQRPTNGWRTIMAYACSSAPCTRINYWSNPSKTYGGVPMGTSTRSDNERVLNTTKATIAGFR